MEARRVWIPSSTEGWSLATIISEDGEKITVRFEDNQVTVIQARETFLFREFEILPDMIGLNELHEATILHNLRQRYMKGQIYTYIGPMIISVNPFQKLPIYGEELIPQYQTKPRDELPPHLFSIANKAFQFLVSLGQSQSVVISGESGAGKTEATKVVLKFLTSVAKSSCAGNLDLAGRILATNPVLEAFGNAKTIRNNNSSRFGKFIKIAFDDFGGIKGARIDNYLLEQTRIIEQAPTERNYHVFYQLINGSDAEEKKKYRLLDGPQDYAYLTSGQVNIEGIDDAADWHTLKNAMTTLQISFQDQENYFRTLSGILHLGNIKFGSVEVHGMKQAVLENPEQLRIVEELLGLKNHSKEFQEALVAKKVRAGKTRGSMTVTPLSPAAAFDNRDALAKAIYSRMFDYLISQLNKHLIVGEEYPENSKFIGVLDIYGFEKFQQNSLEQFCINYANEKLHHQFNEHMFHAEQQEYKNEGVEWTNIDFTDNKATIQLIEGSSGILLMLDEECRMPQGSDKTFLEKLKTRHKANPNMQYNMKSPDEFMILHYAEPVPYYVEGFLNKNRDKLSEDVTFILNKTSSPLLKVLFGSGGEEDGPTVLKRHRESGGRTNTQAVATVTRKFSMSLSDLVATLAASNRHYVRCLKPNNKATPHTFFGEKVLSQLRSNGVLETIKLRKAGFSNRVPHPQFFERYRVMPGLKSASPKHLTKFLRRFSDDKEWAIGHTKVFMRHNGSESLEKKRKDHLAKSLVVLQSYARRWKAMEKLENLRIAWLQRIAATTVLQQHLRAAQARAELSRLSKEYQKKKESACCILQRYVRVYTAREDLLERRNVRLLRETMETAAVLAQCYVRRYVAWRTLGRCKAEAARVQEMEEEERLRLEEIERQVVEEEARLVEEERILAEQQQRQAELLLQQQQHQAEMLLQQQQQAEVKKRKSGGFKAAPIKLSISRGDEDSVESETGSSVTPRSGEWTASSGRAGPRVPNHAVPTSPRRTTRTSPRERNTSKTKKRPSSQLYQQTPLHQGVPVRKGDRVPGYDPQEDIGDALFRVCMRDKNLSRALTAEDIETYSNILRSNLYTRLSNIEEIDAESWAMLGTKGFPVRLRQLLVNEVKPVVVNNERGIVLNTAPTISDQGLSTMFSGLFTTFGFGFPESANIPYQTQVPPIIPLSQHLIPNIHEERDLDLLYQVARMTHIRGDYYSRGLPPKEYILELAALDCQVAYGDYHDIIHTVNKTVRNPDLALFPFNERDPAIEQSVFEYYKQLKHLTPEQAKLRYIRNFSLLPTNDKIIRFYVTGITQEKARRSRRITAGYSEESDKEWILGLSAQKLFKKVVIDGEEKTQAQWEFSKVTRWRYDEPTTIFSIELTDAPPITFSTGIPEGATISALLFHFLELFLTKSNLSSRPAPLKSVVEIEVKLYGQTTTHSFMVKVSQTILEICVLIAKHFKFEVDGRYGLRVESKKRDNSFLVPSKALNQQDVDFDSVFIFCTRLFSPTPPFSKHLDYVAFLLAESRDAVVDSRWLVEREQAVKLAALQVQYFHGDYNSRVHTSNFYGGKLQQLVPEEFRGVGIINKIIQEHQRLAGTPPSDAGYRFIEAVRLLPSYGDTYFQVNIGASTVEVLLQLNFSTVCCLDAASMTPLGEWPIMTLKACNVDATGEELMLLFSEGEIVFHTPEALTIQKLINDYVEIEVVRTSSKTKQNLSKSNNANNNENCAVM